MRPVLSVGGSRGRPSHLVGADSAARSRGLVRLSFLTTGRRLSRYYRSVPGPPRPRVLLADDYAGILTALERLLKVDCEIVACVANGIALLDEAKRLRQT